MQNASVHFFAMNFTLNIFHPILRVPHSSVHGSMSCFDSLITGMANRSSCELNILTKVRNYDVDLIGQMNSKNSVHVEPLLFKIRTEY